MTLTRATLGLLSPAGRGARLTVMILHRVLPEPDPLFPGEPDAGRFEALLRVLGAWFNVLPLGEAVERLETESLPARPLALTFDDGYRDNFTVALPILQANAFPATFFVSTGFLDGGRMWNDTVIESVRRFAGDALDLSALDLGVHSTNGLDARRTAIDSLLARLKYLPAARRLDASRRIAEIARVTPPDDLMLTSDQVLALRRAGMTIGAHTATHPILARLEPAEARAEIERSKADLEALLGERVALFAYPNGKPGTDYLAEHVRMAGEAGFRAAVSTAWGTGRRGCDIFQIPRFTPWARSQARIAFQFGRNFLQTGHPVNGVSHARGVAP